MTADRNDSDARIESDKPARRGQSRAVEASRILVESANLSMSQKLRVIKMLVPVDSAAVVAMMPKIIAEFNSRYTQSTASGPSGSTIQNALDELFKVVNDIAQKDPNGAIDIYFQLVNSKIPSEYRVQATASIIYLEPKR